MANFQIAHIREQGQDIIIVPLNSSYRYWSGQEQNQIRAALQVSASSAGLAGTVVPVWDAGGGRMGFLAPTQLRSYFSNRSLPFVFRNVNKTLRIS